MTNHSIDWLARVRALSEASRHATGFEGGDQAALHDKGYVPPHVLERLTALAANAGFPVTLAGEEDLPEGALGATGQDDLRGNRGIMLRKGMSPASTARVLGHELGHALTMVSESEAQWHLRLLDKALGDPSGERLQEEGMCELATGAFCQQARIGTGIFLHRYMGQHFNRAGKFRFNPNRTEVSKRTLRRAAVLAKTLYEVAA